MTILDGLNILLACYDHVEVEIGKIARVIKEFDSVNIARVNDKDALMEARELSTFN